MSSENYMPPQDGVVITPPRRAPMIRNLVPSLPERGKIKIGMKGSMITSQRGTQFQPPQKLDHFVVTTLQRGKDGNFLRDEGLHAVLGDAPTEIPIRLLYDEPSLNFPTRYACFIGRTLWCSGDGEYASRLSGNPKDMFEPNGSRKAGVAPAPMQADCTCFRQDPTYQGRDKCKMNGALSCIVDGATGLGGVWKFRTTSYNSIVGIISSMAFIRSITGGVLANIPLRLQIQPKQAANPVDGSAVLIYVVGIEFAGDIAQLQNMGHQIALDRARTQVSIKEIETEARRLLSYAPRNNAPLPGDIAEDVVEEFYPEQALDGMGSAKPRLENYVAEVERERIEHQKRPVFAYVTAFGEVREFDEPGTAVDAFMDFLSESSDSKESLQAAWESGAQLILALRECGHSDLAHEAIHHHEALMVAEDEAGESSTAPGDAAGPTGKEDGTDDEVSRDVHLGGSHPEQNDAGSPPQTEADDGRDDFWNPAKTKFVIDPVKRGGKIEIEATKQAFLYRIGEAPDAARLDKMLADSAAVMRLLGVPAYREIQEAAAKRRGSSENG